MSKPLSGIRKAIPVDKNYSLVHHFLEYNATRLPSKIALVHDGNRFSYNDINRFADNLAYWLLQRGVQPGDRVVILLENSLEYVTSYYGILKTGAVAVPLDKDSSTEQVATITENVEPLIYVSNEHNVLRQDVVEPDFNKDLALKNAPSKDSDYFKVPKVIKK